jgi:Putative beta-lactamase-inhibitor-like, PepSY-like
MRARASKIKVLLQPEGGSMKFTGLACVIIALGCAQALPLAAAEQKIACKSIPAAASDAFKAAYPNAVVKNCSKENDKGKIAYEFSSEEGKTHRDVSYSEQGTLIVAEETVTLDAVPDAVKTALKAKYPKGAVTRSEKITGEGVVKYEFRVKNGSKRVEAVFDEQGKEMEP